MNSNSTPNNNPWPRVKSSLTEMSLRNTFYRCHWVRLLFSVKYNSIQYNCWLIFFLGHSGFGYKQTQTLMPGSGILWQLKSSRRCLLIINKDSTMGCFGECSFLFIHSLVCWGLSRGLTHDLSLPLCLSKSRFPRESKPSPLPMPRPLPPRPPRPPPRPLGGLSPEGLTDRNTHQIII